MKRLFVSLAILLFPALPVRAADIYVASSSAGGNTGANSATQTRTVVADCTSGSTTNNANLSVGFRAKSGSAIQYAVSHANSQPNYQVDVEAFQATTN